MLDTMYFKNTNSLRFQNCLVLLNVIKLSLLIAYKSYKQINGLTGS